ncbi:plasma membrane protein Pth11-like protein [Xylaria castorea]|nr:plasma membrane protein Pth11-like protein [Xylaria castorea]
MTQHQEYYQSPGHVIAVGAILPLIDIVIVSMRFWVRKKQGQAVKLDDWLMVPATLFTIGIGISVVYGVAHEGLAYRLRIPPELAHDAFSAHTDQLSTIGRVQWAFVLLLPLTLGCTKASFLLFYARIFSIHKSSLRNKLLQALVAFVAIWTVGFFLAKLFDCGSNFWANWGSVFEFMTICPQTMLVTVIFCATDFAIDVIIICWPIPLIWKLNLTMFRKIAITGIFSLGAVSVAASLTRLVFTARVREVGFDPNADPILTITGEIYWGLVESTAAILAACLPTLQFMFRHSSWETIVTTSKQMWESASLHTRILRTRTSKRSMGAETIPEMPVAYVNMNNPYPGPVSGQKPQNWPTGNPAVDLEMCSVDSLYAERSAER